MSLCCCCFYLVGVVSVRCVLRHTIQDVLGLVLLEVALGNLGCSPGLDLLDIGRELVLWRTLVPDMEPCHQIDIFQRHFIANQKVHQRVLSGHIRLIHIENFEEHIGLVLDHGHQRLG